MNGKGGLQPTESQPEGQLCVATGGVHHRCSVHGQVLLLLHRVWQVSAVRGGGDSRGGAVGHCRDHVRDVRSAQGLLVAPLWAI